MSLSEDLIADVDGITVTNEALNAAMAKIPDRHISLGHWEPGVSHEDMRAALESAAPHIAAAERERIRQLAVDHDAMFLAAVPVPPDYGVSEIETPFADLLGESVTVDGLGDALRLLARALPGRDAIRLALRMTD